MTDLCWHLASQRRDMRLVTAAARLIAVCAVALLLSAGAIADDSEPPTQARPDTPDAQIRSAHQAVEDARATAAAAKLQLDDFVSRHFEEHRELAAAPGAQSGSMASNEDPERGRLQEQMQELTAHRDELLDHLTPAHPEVADVESRIERLSKRLAALDQHAPATEETRTTLNPPGPAEPATNEISGSFAAQQDRDREAAKEYQRLFERWRGAERQFQAAIQAEYSLVQSQAAPKGRPTPIAQAARPAVLAPPARQTVSRIATSPALPQANTSAAIRAPNRSSQPLALGAFLMALVITAWAAVKLARSTSGALFSSVDDVSAALALPVVGVIPASSSPRLAHATESASLRLLTLVAQLVIAIIVFAIVAYTVQFSSFP